MNDFAIVKTYIKRVEAEIGKTKLTSYKIPSFIHADDAGGMRPLLKGAELMVNKSDYEKAKLILENISI